MSKKYYRFFGGLLQTQENWLNKMAEQGCRLISTDKMLYEFIECDPGEFKYKIEFIGHKSAKDAQEYHNFLEDMGYKVFYKNINLNYALGKIKFRPWAEKGGRIATKSTTYNRELLVVEKENDGKSFDLHTSFEDKEKYYRTIRNPWLSFLIIFAVLAILFHSYVYGLFALLSFIPVIFYQYQMKKWKKQAQAKEW